MKRLVLAITLFLAACGSKPGQEVLLPVKSAVANDQPFRMFVATTRGRSATQALYFDNGRSPTVSYVAYDISIPPNHAKGEIEWPKDPPDPRTEFVTVGRSDYDRRGFLNALTEHGNTDVSLFIHGYNNSMEESVFRAAQIAKDADAGGAAILFAWPSAARATGYVADRDAADFSRAALATLIEDLSDSRKVRRIVVIGHSMGGRLTMEALMQLRLKGRSDVLREVEVVLADPDIDHDLFWQQARIVGKLPTPLSVMVAPDDRALRVSQILASGRERIGKADVRDPDMMAKAEAHGVRLIDVTAISTDRMAHSRIVQIAALYDTLPVAKPGTGLRRAGAFVFGAVGLGMAEIGSELGPSR
ncbi:alpha/beta fold hydrolase [Paracoccus methylovorus]|uniref:Alpha/beta fold hydrolase n=1 Tax=Paracoccus methylovorus TaxID=2812658 RepID=A0ABX7JH16_9RHOB|nr:alpha/beta fold hydrolase [Paracoccus methylovorus]QRZ12871.1 alpha/beta fold hydrolase [Paracoccus methylovorus]